MASYIKNRYIAPLYKTCIYTKYACGIYYAHIGLCIYNFHCRDILTEITATKTTENVLSILS